LARLHDDRSAGLGRIGSRHDVREFFVFHLDRANGVHRGFGRGGGDGGDGLAFVAQLVSHFSHLHDRLDALDLLRRGRIELGDLGVRVGRGEQAAEEHSGQADVLRVDRDTGHLHRAVHAAHGFIQ
jgi:hypothetical protein